MGNLAIRARDPSKSYRLAAGGHSPYIRDQLKKLLGYPTRLARRLVRPPLPEEVFWALRDVSFDISRGEVVGVIGRNGAGKSTLLKVLSRITEPSLGEVDLHGRVGSLLEVGSGFHPELTGRENVSLNGAILGMNRAEVRRKFDEIVAFAEVERFIDTPVKFYSSGMYMRLAFAVAAHLEPEILIVDEVLAVGDVQFQKKCLGKMGEVAKGGRTVLFVSHNLGAVAELCNSAILLKAGRMVFRGNVHEAVNRYLQTGRDAGGKKVELPVDETKPMQLIGATLTDRTGVLTDLFDLQDDINIRLTHRIHQAGSGYDAAVILARNGVELFCTLDIDHHPHLSGVRTTGEMVSQVTIPGGLLKAGLYTVGTSTGVTNKSLIEHYPDLLRFEVEELSEDTQFRGYASWRPGHIIAPVRWEDA